MRTVPIGTCYVTEEIPHSGIIYVVVTRRHTGGRVSAALFMVGIYGAIAFAEEAGIKLCAV